MKARYLSNEERIVTLIMATEIKTKQIESKRRAKNSWQRLRTNAVLPRAAIFVIVFYKVTLFSRSSFFHF